MWPWSNTAAIPIPAGLLYSVITGALLSPMIAAGAMALSRIGVVVNAARINSFTPARLPMNVPPTAGSAATARESARTGS